MCRGQDSIPTTGTLYDDEDEAIDDDNSFRPPLGPVKHCGSPVYSGRVCVCMRSQQHLVGQTRVTLGPLVQPSFDIFFNTAVHAHSTNWFATPL